MDAVKKAWSRFQRTEVMRAWRRYSASRGNLLAGGVTYFAFFSIFPAVALAFTIFGALLKGHPEWLDQIRDYLNETLPGFIKEGDEGLIPLEAPTGNTLSVTGAIGVAGLLWAGLGWLGALRDGIRTIFGAEGEPGNFFTNKLRDLGVLVLLGLAI
ncbi:MAG: YihY/virulence factor BrkB family protein, partial [Tetrasphaera sp.]|nr:YihY/virulence factor BrkB family protein [Tetrasphaera sp.]